MGGVVSIGPVDSSGGLPPGLVPLGPGDSPGGDDGLGPLSTVPGRGCSDPIGTPGGVGRPPTFDGNSGP